MRGDPQTHAATHSQARPELTSSSAHPGDMQMAGKPPRSFLRTHGCPGMAGRLADHLKLGRTPTAASVALFPSLGTCICTSSHCSVSRQMQDALHARMQTLWPLRTTSCHSRFIQCTTLPSHASKGFVMSFMCFCDGSVV